MLKTNQNHKCFGFPSTLFLCIIRKEQNFTEYNFELLESMFMNQYVAVTFKCPQIFRYNTLTQSLFIKGWLRIPALPSLQKVTPAVYRKLNCRYYKVDPLNLES